MASFVRTCLLSIQNEQKQLLLAYHFKVARHILYFRTRLIEKKRTPLTFFRSKMVGKAERVRSALIKETL